MNDQMQTNQPTPSKRVVREKKPRGGRVSILNILSFLAIIAVVALFAWTEKERRSTEQELRQTSAELEEIRRNSQVTGEELSRQVLERVRAHMDISMDPEPTVATIVDVDALKAANQFYEPAKNGDHLIITSRRAILYDPDRDMILDVVPVIIDQEDSGQDAASETEGEDNDGEDLEDDDAEEDATIDQPAGF